ncbi:MAG: hypothetical protein JXA98_04095 [Methanosarcinaceae archaeon]|nr:hypothetical protein [Methanosarcinaceae archaeon]
MGTIGKLLGMIIVMVTLIIFAAIIYAVDDKIGSIEDIDEGVEVNGPAPAESYQDLYGKLFFMGIIAIVSGFSLFCYALYRKSKIGRY